MFCLSSVWHGAVWGQILCCLILVAGAIPLCNVAEKTFGRKDDRRIVADEYCTFPICMIGLPINIPALVLAFITNRIFDIIKPPPAGWAQRLPGGFGIVADDAISVLYSLALNHALYPLLMRNWQLSGN